jgi:exodeoxyribonuclease V gamma subunit
MKVIPYATFDELAAAFAKEVSGPLSSLKPHRVVVPSLSVDDHLRLRVAIREGICLGIRTMMPQEFIREILAVLRGDESADVTDAWSKERLAWRIFPKLEGMRREVGLATDESRDRFALACLIGDRFDQYAHFRPEILKAWSDGQSFFNGQIEHESWQKDLWCSICSEIGTPHPSLSLECAPPGVDQTEKLLQSWPEVSVLGTGTLDPLLIRVLKLLDRCGTDVRVHVILPSMEFLGDLHRKGMLPSDGTDPEAIVLEGEHPLLCSLARHAVGAFHLLEKLDPQHEEWAVSENDDASATAHLLGRVQSDIRSRRSPSVGPVCEDDSSIRIHSCCGTRRELEAVRDEILRAFDEIPDLKPDEIHLVAPKLDDYAPLVNAVLEHGKNPLPVQMTQIPSREENTVIAALGSLLEMGVKGRFEASTLLDLIRLDAVRAKLGIADDDGKLDLVRCWIRDTGLTHGLGGLYGMDENTHPPGDWFFAADRLTASRFLDGDSMSRYESGDPVLPILNPLGGETELRSNFLGWFSYLRETMILWSENECIPEIWEERLKTACSELLAGDEEIFLPVNSLLKELAEAPCTEKIDIGIILDWFLDAAASRPRRGHVSGRILFGTFRHLQNIPCRVLLMLGMEDGAFPGESRVPAWDLLKASAKVWDRNARIDDRQLFLDALLTPSDRLIITASNQNARTMKEVPLSSCVDELLRVLKAMGASEKELLIKHRLQPFAPDYFLNQSRLPRSYDTCMQEVAIRLLNGNERQDVPFQSKQLDKTGVEPSAEITISELAEFWKDPAKAYIRFQGITLPREEGHDEDLDRTPVILDHLEKWKLKQEIITQEISANSPLSILKDKLGADRQLPARYLGGSVWEENQLTCSAIADSVRKTLGDRKLIQVPVTVTLGDEGDRKVMMVVVSGEILLNQQGASMLGWGIGKMDKPKHFIPAWMNAILAGADGKILPTTLHTEKHPIGGISLQPISKQDADDLLKLLVRGFMEGKSRPLCYAPSTSEEMTKPKPNIGKTWGKQFMGEGEGETPSAKLAWRGLDPFENEDWKTWLPLAESLKQWRKAK